MPHGRYNLPRSEEAGDACDPTPANGTQRTGDAPEQKRKADRTRRAPTQYKNHRKKNQSSAETGEEKGQRAADGGTITRGAAKRVRQSELGPPREHSQATTTRASSRIRVTQSRREEGRRQPTGTDYLIKTVDNGEKEER